METINMSSSLNPPKKPAKATTAFTFFANQHREAVRLENPQAHFSELGRILGEKWIALPDEQKQVSFICFIT